MTCTFPPRTRLRRLRENRVLAESIREVSLEPRQMILPLFVVPGSGKRTPISGLHGVDHWSVGRLCEGVDEALTAGVQSFMLFGLPTEKDANGSTAWRDDQPVQQALRFLKERYGREIQLITDVCMCEYTSHGHCGIVSGDRVQNDRTLLLLAKTALSHAQAGADIVAPSDMMDARVSAIREALDEGGFEDTAIMAYSAKYASAFYGPFREAAECAPQFGDRKAYQMDPANSDEAIREITLDVEEGADIIMVKPALPYLDIIRRAREEFDLPIAAYNVSGEFAMIQAAAQLGWLDGERAMMEALTSIKRAGADIILTYFAQDAARAIQAAR